MVFRIKGNLLILLTLFSFTLFAQNYSYVTVVAKKGDGIYTLLKKHQLSSSSKNRKHFVSLNQGNFTSNDGLILGKTYKLPILVYSYNGKSIRSTIDMWDYQKAKKIESYNYKLKSHGIKKSIYKKDKVLWVPLDLFQPKNFQSASNNIYPIFGPKYQKVKIIDNKLAGHYYYIVSGHGGPDPGAIGKKNGKQLHEDEYAYDVSLRFARNLISHGATVYIIVRDTSDGIRDDEILNTGFDEYYYGGKSISENQKTRLMDRANIVNALFLKNKAKAKSQNCVVIHVDSRASNQKIDMFYYYQYGKSLSKKTAEKYYKTVEQKYAKFQPNRGYKGKVLTRELYMLKYSVPNTIYIELGNIQNTYDHKRLLSPANRQVIANWFTDAELSLH